MTQVVNEKYFNESSIELCDVNIKKNPCLWSPKTTLFLTTELHDLYIQVRVESQRKRKFLVRQDLSFCSMEKYPGLNLFVRLVFDQLKSKINFKFECPLKKV